MLHSDTNYFMLLLIKVADKLSVHRAAHDPVFYSPIHTLPHSWSPECYPSKKIVALSCESLLPYILISVLLSNIVYLLSPVTGLFVSLYNRIWYWRNLFLSLIGKSCNHDNALVKSFRNAQIHNYHFNALHWKRRGLWFQPRAILHCQPFISNRIFPLNILNLLFAGKKNESRSRSFYITHFWVLQKSTS